MLKGVIGPLGESATIEVEKFKLSFMKKSDEELAEAYFRQQKIGIVGVTMQMYYLIALKQVLEERFGDSPIYFDGNLLEL